MNHPYDDILSLPHPVSATHPPMPLIDRAAQFAPFAALTGYEAAVLEAARLTETRPELDENRKEELNACLQILKACGQDRPQAEICYFKPDERKSGGACVTVAGTVKKVDDFTGRVTMADGTVIPMEDILNIKAEYEEGHI
ncbi:MAG: hypothetical protein ACI4O0_08525 [Candidatus Limivicinus sp.]